MRVETRTSIHFGVNWYFAPPPDLEGSRLRQFEAALGEEGVEFSKVEKGDGKVMLGRGQPFPIQVRIAVQPNTHLGQLTIISALPNRTLDEFEDEAEVICRAFAGVWDGSFQVVHRDCTIRHLYDVEAGHAFQYLWEKRLGQDTEELAMLGHDVLGGGLRFVMPPTESEDPKQIEVKIESFLRESRKLFVDVQMTWPKPTAPSQPMAPRDLLDAVSEYATGEVVNFIQGHKE